MKYLKCAYDKERPCDDNCVAFRKNSYLYEFPDKSKKIVVNQTWYSCVRGDFRIWGYEPDYKEGAGDII